MYSFGKCVQSAFCSYCSFCLCIDSVRKCVTVCAVMCYRLWAVMILPFRFYLDFIQTLFSLDSAVIQISFRLLSDVSRLLLKGSAPRPLGHPVESRSAPIYQDVWRFGGLTSKIKFSIDPSGRELLGRNALFLDVWTRLFFIRKYVQGVSFYHAKRDLHTVGRRKNGPQKTRRAPPP